MIFLMFASLYSASLPLLFFFLYELRLLLLNQRGPFTKTPISFAAHNTIRNTLGTPHYGIRGGLVGVTTPEIGL